MPRRPVSITLDEANLLWLRGRARIATGGNLSEAVDQLVSEARAGQRGALVASRSVVGTVDLMPDDADLGGADEAMKALFAASLRRPLMVRDGPGGAASATARPRRLSGKRGYRG